MSMSLEKTLKQKAKEVKKYRTLLFPLLGYNVITGFNIYETKQPTESKFILNYLHSDLDENKSHRQELEEKLKAFFNTLSFRKITFEKIDRHTAYKLKKGWEAQKYYNISGEELKGKELGRARFLNETIIGAAYQNDLEMPIDSINDLKKILEIFRKHCNFYLIDKNKGTYVKSKKGNKLRNRQRIVDSWEIPLIILKSEEELNLISFPKVDEIKIEKDSFFIDIIADNRTKILTEFLQKCGEFPNSNRAYANKSFIDWINKGIYSRKYRTFLKTFKSF